MGKEKNADSRCQGWEKVRKCRTHGECRWHESDSLIRLVG